MATQKLIGFANKFFTLWDHRREEVYQKYNGEQYISRIVDHYTYIQNLSIDEDTAIEKAKDMGCKDQVVHEWLRGQTSSFVKVKYFEKPQYNDNQFKKGKFEAKTFEEIANDADNSNYCLWYYKNVDASELLINILKANGFVSDLDGTLLLTKDYEKEVARRNASGHHFEDGQKVELNLKEIDYFSFQGAFGTTNVVTYLSDCGKLFKYMGSSCPDIDTEFTKVRCTLKWSEYKGEKETRIQRVKKIK